MEYYAHVAPDGRKQTVDDHLSNVSALCGDFADAFSAKQQGEFIGIAHDIGKKSSEFQDRLAGGAIVDHSTAGAYECAKTNKLWAAACVAGHHTGIPDIGTRFDTSDDSTLIGRLLKAREHKIPLAYDISSLPCADNPVGYFESNENWLTNSFIIRFLYSCLVDADFLDTEAFMNNKHFVNKSAISLNELSAKLNLYINNHFSSPSTDINKARWEILQACRGKSNNPRGIYTLSVPTGGGKTISSIAFALNHAVKHNMDRIIYVIPYTSIIEQNADVFRGIFGKENVLEHHSNACFDTVCENDSVLKTFMLRATENWDMPIVVTTAVQFFDSLYSNKPSKCRKLHNIANSVIIFDEAQLLPIEHLRPCVAAISKLVEDMRSTIVLCTATQPVLNDLFACYAPGHNIVELCPDNGKLFKNFKRISFKNAGNINTEELVNQLTCYDQCLCVVNTRKSAQAVYDALPAGGKYHLSTLMYPVHRKKVLEEIRNRLNNNEPCRVVSTSLIEAGVDIDFPAVFRELTGLDSILQAAGRCNREGKRSPEESVVTVFEGVSRTPLMLKRNIQASRDALGKGSDPFDPDTVRKYFESYRSLTRDDLDATSTIENLSSANMCFDKVAEKFHLINQDVKTVYVPLDEGKALADLALAGKADKNVFRKLGQYGVNIYDNEYNQLLERGVTTKIDDGSAVLLNLGIYRDDKGLAVYEPAETAIFI